jgi:wyosine [tRNA(Phe)-imidazoG37] synthetase (radical SAM superfamily)
VKYKHIFGPVLSRRLNVSLGIDLVPYKTCSFDCVYCECGSTTNKTIERKPYIPFNDLKIEIDEFLKNKPVLDYITLGGSGEPTLNSDIGKIIEYLKTNYSKYKVAVLTNSSLLFDKNVRNDLLKADVVLPSLDAVSEQAFSKINKHISSINADEIINGLIEFRKEYKGAIWLEIFVLKDINDKENQILEMKEILKKINPDKIQINTLDRPGAEQNISSVEYSILEKFAEILKDFNVEIVSRKKISKIKETDIKIEKSSLKDRIISSLKRRPETLEELSISLNTEKKDISDIIFELEKTGKIEKFSENNLNFFIIKK